MAGLPDNGKISHSMIMAEFEHTGKFRLSNDGGPMIDKASGSNVKESDFYGAENSTGSFSGKGNAKGSFFNAGDSPQTGVSHSGVGSPNQYRGGSSRNDTVRASTTGYLMLGGPDNGFVLPATGLATRITYSFDLSATIGAFDGQNFAYLAMEYGGHPRLDANGVGQFLNVHDHRGVPSGCRATTKSFTVDKIQGDQGPGTSGVNLGHYGMWNVTGLYNENKWWRPGFELGTQNPLKNVSPRDYWFDVKDGWPSGMDTNPSGNSWIGFKLVTTYSGLGISISVSNWSMTIEHP